VAPPAVAKAVVTTVVVAVAVAVAPVAAATAAQMLGRRGPVQTGAKAVSRLVAGRLC